MRKSYQQIRELREIIRNLEEQTESTAQRAQASLMSEGRKNQSYFTEITNSTISDPCKQCKRYEDGLSEMDHTEELQAQVFKILVKYIYHLNCFNFI